MEIVTRRDAREGFLADQMTMYSLNYIFQESFELSGTFVKMVLGNNKVDIDRIYDWCELNHVSLTNTLRKAANTLYNKSSPYQKTIYFYKFIHDLGLELRDLVSAVYNLLSDELMHSRTDLTYENIIWAYMDKLDEYTGLDGFTQSEHNLKIIDLFGMNTKDELKRLSGSVHDTFNNVIKNQYRVRLQEGMDALNNLRSGYVDMPAVWTGTIGTSSLITSTYLPQTITYNIGTPGTGSSYMNTYTSSLANEISSVRYLVDGWEDLLHPNIGTQIRTTMLPTPNKKTLKKEKLNKNTPGVRRLNKSLKVFRKYVPANLATNFLRCLEITIPGKTFNWSLRLKSRKDLVTYSEYLNNAAISYDLYVMTKNNIKISRCCIVFNGCPILDEVLATYMMIKTGRELDILNGSGFFDKDKTLFDMFIDPLLNKEEPPTNAISDLINSYTLDGSNPNRLQPEQIRHPAEIKSRIRSWLVSYLSRYIPDDIMEYTTNLDVSWGEAVDYEVFQLFNVNDFNHYVRPLTWSINKL